MVLYALVAAIVFILLSFTTTVKVYGINAWIKPFKFALSTALLSWAMAWYIGYLPNFNPAVFNWVIIITLGFEIVYIALQASKGQLSHYNLSSPLYSVLYSLMATAATVATFAVAYIGFLFFTQNFPELPPYYVWAIRIGIVVFVVFSLEGFVMGSRLTHTIGGPDGESGIPLLNWSTKYGDPRIAHFIGMHALQVIPILSYHLLKSTRLTLATGVLYALLAVFTLVQALQGKPFLKF
ncbi:MAG: hypothetical protein M0D57_05970 [Sphingobacteriales bacterium JAD_PAG50586_3]|nr:MAG: hypothetical protein M0D57_05970 [Sphingobacteriales bacterium JAD_PAG50586_3]